MNHTLWQTKYRGNLNVRKVANIGPGKAAKSSSNPEASASRRPTRAAPKQTSASNFERF
jgi:hypothetical protein